MTHVFSFLFTVEHYTKGFVRDIEDINPYLESYPDAIHMKVQNGSKIKNLMGYAMKKLKVSDYY